MYKTWGTRSARTSAPPSTPRLVGVHIPEGSGQSGKVLEGLRSWRRAGPEQEGAVMATTSLLPGQWLPPSAGVSGTEEAPNAPAYHRSY